MDPLVLKSLQATKAMSMAVKLSCDMFSSQCHLIYKSFGIIGFTELMLSNLREAVNIPPLPNETPEEVKAREQMLRILAAWKQEAVMEKVNELLSPVK